MRSWRAHIWLPSALLLLVACGPTRTVTEVSPGAPILPPVERGTYKVGKPYQIDGVWYYPREDFGYAETGIASWYGEAFHAKRTANGERYDMTALTAAHRTLPLPSLVRVTNLENGRSLVVRVNDRGPFARGRIIDMSSRSATLLGFQGQGTAKVRVEVMARESRLLADLARDGRSEPEQLVALGNRFGVAYGGEPVLASVPVPATSAIFVQAGAFTIADNAHRLQARLASLGPSAVASADVNGTRFYRVRIGPLATVDAADAMLDRVVSAGYQQAKVMVE
ncbi:MAG: septal ring lytic transglycosylase RlpA family protein [Alphaproteobacteria bacterium]|nr:septal ring lytic transglycosylase RlpA family protein [Alphaproteobacteria bacterium]